jgi:F420-dependent oxidoreductase-like protein
VRHSFKIWPQEVEWPVLRDVWIEADRGGFWDASWLNDHLFPPKAPEELPIMEAWSLLAALAATTGRLRFGTMVSSNTFRHPSVLAKTIATIDRISGGRLEIGIGAGWHEREHEAFGIELPPLPERFDRLDETFTILDGLLRNETFSFDGPFHRLVEAKVAPRPVQTPRPPFLIGGAGPRRTIPLAAKWADQWNYPDYVRDPAAFRASHSRLLEACEEIGRDPSEIEVSVQFRYPGDTSETVDLVSAYEAEGADHVLISFSPPGDPSLPPRVAEALADR